MPDDPRLRMINDGAVEVPAADKPCFCCGASLETLSETRLVCRRCQHTWPRDMRRPIWDKQRGGI